MMNIDLAEPDAAGVLYDIRKDTMLLKQMRKASLSDGPWGLTVENGIVGSDEWWGNVESGKVKVETLRGVIGPLDHGPMGDFPTVKIIGELETKSWAAWEGFSRSLIGMRVEVRYAKIPPRFPWPGKVDFVSLLIQVRDVSGRKV